MYTLLTRLEKDTGKENAAVIEEFKERIQLFHSLIEEKVGRFYPKTFAII
jgi:hypothetical protein